VDLDTASYHHLVDGAPVLHVCLDLHELLRSQISLDVCLEIDVVDPVFGSTVFEPVAQVVAALDLGPLHGTELVAFLFGEGLEGSALAGGHNGDEALEGAFDVLNLVVKMGVGDLGSVGVGLGGRVEGFEGGGKPVHSFGEIPDHFNL
jgi:hypothetical protein